MSRMYSGPELLELDCMLPKYMSTLLLNQQCYHPLLLAMVSIPYRDSGAYLGPRDPKTELGNFFIHCCESGAEAFLLVNISLHISTTDTNHINNPYPKS